MPRSSPRSVALAAALALAFPVPAHAQHRPAAASAIQTCTFGERGAGAYPSMVIRNAMVIPGHGGPPAGPYDSTTKGAMITERWCRSTP